VRLNGVQEVAGSNPAGPISSNSVFRQINAALALETGPSTELENDFLRVHGFSEYAKWYLGIDDCYPENTKRRYKFSYGDFKNVHRCGAFSVQSRAGEYRYSEIEKMRQHN
jgi:hypothetical protein